MNRWLTTAISAAVFALAGCGHDYDHTDIDAVQPSALGGTVSTQAISVPEGLVVKAHIVPWNDDKDPLSLQVRSKDTTTLQVSPTVNDRVYAFIGLKTGQTEVEFVADGTVVMTVLASVTAQESAP
jgi:hypothetical protein